MRPVLRRVVLAGRHAVPGVQAVGEGLLVERDLDRLPELQVLERGPAGLHGERLQRGHLRVERARELLGVDELLGLRHVHTRDLPHVDVARTHHVDALGAGGDADHLEPLDAARGLVPVLGPVVALRVLRLAGHDRQRDGLELVGARLVAGARSLREVGVGIGDGLRVHDHPGVRREDGRELHALAGNQREAQRRGIDRGDVVIDLSAFKWVL